MNETNELQHLIEDCWSVGIIFPELLDEDDYKVLFAIAKLLELHRKRLLNNPYSDSLIELR